MNMASGSQTLDHSRPLTRLLRRGRVWVSAVIQFSCVAALYHLAHWDAATHQQPMTQLVAADPPKANRKPAPANKNSPPDGKAAAGDTPAAAELSQPLVTVNGRVIARRDLRRWSLLQGSLGPAPVDEAALLEFLIDRELIRQLLDKYKIPVTDPELDPYVDRFAAGVRAKGSEPEAELAKVGWSQPDLRAELALPIRWDKHVRQAVTTQQLRQRFDKFPAKYDGTRVRIRQIVLLDPPPTAAADSDAQPTADPATLRESEQTLRLWRTELLAGRELFGDLARRYSMAPSAEDGGELEWISGAGELPAAVWEAALRLEPGDLSQPIRSPSGWHLVEVTEREQGQLTLEDARPQLLGELSAELWRERVAELRKSAKITRK